MTHGMGVFDYNLMFKSDSTNLTKDTLYPSSGIKIYGTGLKGMAARVVFPSTDGTYTQVLPEIWVSEDDTTYRLAATYPGGALSWASGGKEILLPFTVPARKYMYTKIKFTVTGQTTGGSLGPVQAGLVLPGMEYDRTVDFTR